MNELPATYDIDADGEHDHDRGLGFDLPKLLERRRLLQLFGGGALAAIVGGGALGTSRRVAMAAACVVIPEETAGPYPGDGSNGPNVLTQSGILRSDIRSSFGSSSTTAAGIPTTITLTVTDTTTGCTAAAGLAVYLWHCNTNGLYSMYSPGITGENYLRGVQVTDSNGQVKFTTIFPGAYSGRWPHVHFEVYPSLASATASADRLATSQMALPKAACDLAYATAAYSSSKAQFAVMTLATDNVFGDGAATQTASYTGDATNGFALALDVGVMANGVGSLPTGDTTVTPTNSPSSVYPTSAFVPLPSPRRLLDTRADSLVGFTGTKPAAGSTTVVTVLGRESIPTSGVTAVVLNLAATESTAPGYVTAYPDGTRPTASSLNLERAGQTRSNLVTVPVGADGAVRLYSQSGTHLVADVFGYFVPAATSRSGRFQTLTPARLLDTRADSLVGYSGPKPVAGTTVIFSVLGRFGVPSTGVAAVILNVTAADATAAGFVTGWPEGTRPTTANLNVESVGQTIGNQMILPVGADGLIRVFTQSGAHLIVDVAGWYTDATAASGTSGLFIPVSPYRVLDTRVGARPAAGSTVTLLAAASGTAAAGRSGFAMNVTAVDAAEAGFVTVWPSGIRPLASSLNVADPTQIIGNHVTMAAGSDGGVRLFTLKSTHLIADVTGWYV